MRKKNGFLRYNIQLYNIQIFRKILISKIFVKYIQAILLPIFQHVFISMRAGWPERLKHWQESKLLFHD